ncbi:putative carboxypeptidase D [Lupinus albus]|uniref:Putative carboxypeptidase D n=1 Tax=Lupinus albus TaxID=3870 RepID=A0A6A4P9H5_LUPAL|nr:putative carboxypeptidase D [Lupinus albus]
MSFLYLQPTLYIQIGNAVINDETDNRGTFDYLASHAIISDQIVIDPCSGVYTHAYFNHANVQEALHSNVTKLKYDWNPAMILYFQSGVGGYAEVYNECLTFATVREAGHEVPSHQPGRALSLIMHFLNNTPLPTTKRQP